MSLTKVALFEKSNGSNSNVGTRATESLAISKNMKYFCKRNIDFDGNGTNNKVPRIVEDEALQNSNDNGPEADWHPSNGTRYLLTDTPPSRRGRIKINILAGCLAN